MKKLVMMLCMVMMLCLCIPAAFAEAEQIGLVQMTYASKVRSMPDSEAEIVGSVAADHYYGCFGKEDGWYLIKTADGKMGYVGAKRCVFYNTVAPGDREPVVLSAETVDTIAAGDIVIFGQYEQDNDAQNGVEPIEWIVLEKDEETNQIFLLTRFAVERQHYHTTNSNAVWETSGLRKWLNKTFLQTAFTEEEQQLIALSDVTADQNPKFRTTSGGDTQDKVFLLSMTEAEKYLSEADLICMPTAYSIVRNSYCDAQTGGCWWWLRTPGHNRMHTAYVNWKGEISGKGYGVIANKGAVRPAIRVDLTQLK